MPWRSNEMLTLRQKAMGVKNMINLTINGKKITVEEGTTILEAAKQNNI